MQNLPLDSEKILELDRSHLWHPYSSINSDIPVFPIKMAHGCYLELYDGRKLLDGMASWWSAIHGYNNPHINAAAQEQLQKLSHVMFGGLTHEPAAKLAQQLVSLSPPGLEKVFFSDSGSVSVEVAMKLAIQYWQAKNQPARSKFLSLRNGYHGDTFAAMSVCDPVTGMHHLFNNSLPQQIFAEAPTCLFGEPCTQAHLQDIQEKISTHHQDIAAVILEPIVQGAGGMRFYSAEYLVEVSQLCKQYDLLLIADEIATGFGRTGKFFACEYADITPDIMCVGKALTAGYLSLAATLCTDSVATTICNNAPGVFMHGPTFMANPLACAIASASIELLTNSNWQDNIARVEKGLSEGLQNAKNIQGVTDVRVLGAIGVIELENAVDMEKIQSTLVEHGVWLRPFGKLVYMMPPYVISDSELHTLTSATLSALKSYLSN